MTWRFRHCFPISYSRYNTDESSRSAEEMSSKGLEQLESLLTWGLMLLPELQNFRISRFRRDSATSERFRHYRDHKQVRVCFTFSAFDRLFEKLLPDSRLANHLDFFGDFWVGFDQDVGREMGLTPVQYYYSPEELADDKTGLSAFDLGSSVPALLFEVRDMLRALSFLASGEADPEDPHWKPEWSGGHTDSRTAVAGLKALRQANPDLLSTLFPFAITYIEDNIEHLDLLLSLYQTTDGEERKSNYLYYSQAEWRLLDHNGPELELLLLDKESEKLEGYRQKALVALDNVGSDFRGDRKLFLGLSRPDGFVHFRNLISEIGCPKAVRSEVDEMVERFQLSGVEVKPH